jgi:hypothetical protein
MMKTKGALTGHAEDEWICRSETRCCQARKGYQILFNADGFSFWYRPIVPVADNDDLAQNMRLMLYHSKELGPRLFVASPGDLQAGWVIGV